MSRFRHVSAAAAVALVIAALVGVTLLAVYIDVWTGVSVATVGWLYLLVILPVTLRWGRMAGLATSGAALLLLLTFETEPRGLPYTHSGVDILRIAVSMGAAAIAVVLVDRSAHRLTPEDRVLAMLAAVPDGAIAGHDLNGTICRWSAGAERLFGYSDDEALGRSVAMLLPPDRNDEPALMLERLERGESAFDLETRRLTKSGRALDVVLSAAPIRNGAGILTGLSMNVRDITARRQIERVLQANQVALVATVEDLPDAVIVLDGSGQIVVANGQAQSLLQTPELLQRGEYLLSLLKRRYALRPSADWKRFTLEPGSPLLAMERDRATPRYLHIACAPIDATTSAASCRYVLTIRDVSTEVQGAQVSRGWTGESTTPEPAPARSPGAQGNGLLPTPNGAVPAAVETLPASPALTGREREILALIASSKSNQEIATELGITLNTVERHIANMYRRHHLRGRVDAAAFALRHGLVDRREA